MVHVAGAGTDHLTRAGHLGRGGYVDPAGTGRPPRSRCKVGSHGDHPWRQPRAVRERLGGIPSGTAEVPGRVDLRVEATTMPREREMIRRSLIIIGLLLLDGSTAPAQVERVWLTHRTHDPSRLVVNWTSKEPGDSIVRYGTTGEYGQIVSVDGATTLHHVVIPLAEEDTVYHYSVSTGPQRSPDATFKAYPTEELRVAVVANWHGRPDLGAILKDDVHLLLTAGDNIPGLWQRCGPGWEDCITPYDELGVTPVLPGPADRAGSYSPILN